MTKISDIASAIETGKLKTIAELVQSAIDAGEDPMSILNDSMVSAMSAIGERFSRGEAFVPEMLIAAKTMKIGVQVLKPHLSKEATTVHGTVVIGTVQGDNHDIGKNLVAMMLESAGFEVVDLEVDVPLDRFVAAIQVARTRTHRRALYAAHHDDASYETYCRRIECARKQKRVLHTCRRRADHGGVRAKNRR